MNEIEKLKKLNQYMRDYLVYFTEHNWNADEADRQHQEALKGLIELEEEIEKGYGEISRWVANNGWTGYIEKIDSGYPEAKYSAVLTEGFGTYETLEEAEAYLIENDYKKVEDPTSDTEGK